MQRAEEIGQSGGVQKAEVALITRRSVMSA